MTGRFLGPRGWGAVSSTLLASDHSVQQHLHCRYQTRMLREGHMRPRIALIFAILASLTFARPEAARYLRWTEIQPLLAGVPASAEKAPDLSDAKHWDAWVHQHDAEIRAGTERCIEDSISMLIIFGTSFTTQPRLASPADAVTPAGSLTSAARS